MPSANYPEVRGQINRRLHGRHPGDARPGRSVLKARQEISDRSGRSSHLNLHRAVGEVSNGSTQAETGSLPPRPPAKTHTLYAALEDYSRARFGDIWLH